MHFIKLAFVATVLVPLTLRAQVNATDSIARKDSAPNALELDTVAVHEKRAETRGYNALRILSTTRTNVPLLNVPQSVTVLTSAVLVDQSVQSMAEIARMIPGVTFGQGEGHRDAPTIRGNASTADFFMDGVRDDAQYFRDIYNGERVEALKGSNAMIFGRGGGGGVINRVSKTAEWRTRRSVVFEGGSDNHRRMTADFGTGITSGLATRLNAMAEHSGSFRQSTALSRSGINPTATLMIGKNLLSAGYERFNDTRTVDRGIPSFQGRPVNVPIDQFFGDPSVSTAELRANNGYVAAEREWGSRFTGRNRTLLSSYNKSYANVYPGAVSSNGSQVTITGYRNRHDRSSIFNQTDLVLTARIGNVAHTLLAGSEFGSQKTLNFRETGFFGTATSLTVPLSAPRLISNVVYRQSATDADNDVRAQVAAIYAQDQISIGKHWQAIVGVREEAFNIRYYNRRNADKLARADRTTSPRAGLIFKPVDVISLYGSVSVSHLPSAGDQFSSLTATTATLKPERFTNRELGFKWDVGSGLSVSSSLYRLNRENTSAPSPVDPTRIIQTGRQRSTGFEGNLAGNITPKWQVIAGVANQSAEIIDRTIASRAGATVPLVPGKTASFWTRYDVTPRIGFGLGLVAQSNMYAAIDNTVTLPGFERTDAALFFAPVPNLRAQVNLENVFNVRYFASSNGNNNILPGAPRTVRFSLRIF